MASISMLNIYKQNVAIRSEARLLYSLRRIRKILIKHHKAADDF
jgi:hypothetical protein